jgi:competence ComEA-like helix-hairpin-helix protein
VKNTALACLLAVCILFIGFAGGFFLGRNMNHTDVQHTHRPAATTENPGAKLNINTATVAQLRSLPGVGPVLAERILTYRQEHGDFISTEQLLLVEGIGEALLDSLKDHITTGG